MTHDTWAGFICISSWDAKKRKSSQIWGQIDSSDFKVWLLRRSQRKLEPASKDLRLHLDGLSPLDWSVVGDFGLEKTCVTNLGTRAMTGQLLAVKIMLTLVGPHKWNALQSLTTANNTKVGPWPGLRRWSCFRSLFPSTWHSRHVPNTVMDGLRGDGDGGQQQQINVATN